jgi:hypothetical protein
MKDETMHMQREDIDSAKRGLYLLYRSNVRAFH